MLNDLRTLLTGELLRWAVGQAIFCEGPACDRLLDVSTAGLVTIGASRSDGSNPSEKSVVLCGGCIPSPERLAETVDEGRRHDVWVTVEVAREHVVSNWGEAAPQPQHPDQEVLL